jgi:hypothetical protein
VVEVSRALSSKLEVLPLVFTHGDVRSPVDQHVGGLQDRVGEEAQLERRLGFLIKEGRVL